VRGIVGFNLGFHHWSPEHGLNPEHGDLAVQHPGYADDESVGRDDQADVGLVPPPFGRTSAEQ
jgi:hypothetical protein